MASNFPTDGVSFEDVMALVSLVRSGQWMNRKLECLELSLWISGCLVAKARAMSGEYRPTFGLSSASAADLALEIEGAGDFTDQEAADLSAAVVMELQHA